jgi:hypothetical protein
MPQAGPLNASGWTFKCLKLDCDWLKAIRISSIDDVQNVYVNPCVYVYMCVYYTFKDVSTSVGGVSIKTYEIYIILQMLDPRIQKYVGCGLEMIQA